MSDLIDRQAAIDAIECEYYDYVTVSRMKRVIAELPSAQPEIIRCKDCYWLLDDGNCNGWGWPARAVKPDEWCCRGKRSDEGADA